MQKTTKESQKRASIAEVIDPAATHRVGERCRARVLFVDADAKRVGALAAAAPRARARRGVTTSTTSSARVGKNPAGEPGRRNVVLGPGGRPSVSCGAAATDAAWIRSFGALLELEDADGLKTLGYCHISLRDGSTAIEKLEKTFKVNARVRCRVVGRRAVDGISVVSARRSVVDQPFLSADELEPGMRVRGEVVALEPFSTMVRLGDVRPLQTHADLPPHPTVSDVPAPTASSAKVKEGAISQFRVLSVDKLRRRVAVTPPPLCGASWRWWRRWRTRGGRAVTIRRGDRRRSRLVLALRAALRRSPRSAGRCRSLERRSSAGRGVPAGQCVR